MIRGIRPASGANPIIRSNAGPKITLPGPELPQALNSLQDAGVSKILVDRPKAAGTGARGWLVTFGVAGVLAAGFLALDLYNASGSAAEHNQPPTEVQAAAQAVTQVAIPGPVVGPSVPPPASASPTMVESYLLAKTIEVTGFRFVDDKKPEVRYVVINHSAGPLGAVTVYVTLRSLNARPGQAPLYHFSFKAPSLGPFESKEMAAAIDKSLDKSTATADWQNLHADIELGQ